LCRQHAKRPFPGKTAYRTSNRRGSPDQTVVLLRIEVESGHIVEQADVAEREVVATESKRAARCVYHLTMRQPFFVGHPTLPRLGLPAHALNIGYP
jgi:hypothetical protein